MHTRKSVKVIPPYHEGRTTLNTCNLCMCTCIILIKLYKSETTLCIQKTIIYHTTLFMLNTFKKQHSPVMSAYVIITCTIAMYLATSVLQNSLILIQI